ncbi:MAG TPA: peptide deformylase [Candidatus Paceibacterota bacterium]|nr:peptide deformylase [Candidatus Paceibacterota bacterium]
MRTLVPPDHPALHQKAQPIPREKIGSAEIRGLIADMKAILAAERLGVAIAAPQVGEPLALFVVAGKVFEAPAEEADDGGSDAAPEPAEPMRPDAVFINPEILKLSRRRQDMHEGCLTLPGLWGMVPRAERVRLRYLDEHGGEQVRGAGGLLAHVFQHETDHLEGILYVEKAHDLYEEHPDDTAHDDALA